MLSAASGESRLNPFFFRARLQQIFFGKERAGIGLNPFFFTARLQQVQGHKLVPEEVS